jgi:integrase
MPIHKLGPGALKRTRPGMYGDGGNLWLQVTRAKGGGANRSWTFRYVVGGRTREMGLGSCNTVTLQRARELAQWHRMQLLEHVDPIEHRRADRAAWLARNAKIMTFEQAARGYIAAKRDEWRSRQHAAEWPASLRKHIYPTLGKIEVAAIDTALVVKALQPIWSRIPESASRLRGRVEAILDWCTVSGFRQGDNPARWGGHLEHLLAAPSKRRIKHLSALPWREVPAFMEKLRATDTVVARAMEFTILTAARRGEVRGALWREIEFDTATWIVPGERMKAGREHRVPLSPRALTILQDIHATATGEHVFPGRNGGLGESAFEHLLKRLGHSDVTLHGFRSAFRDWVGESTNYPREIAEAALAHAVGNKVERSYRRGDALEKRRRLMEAWADFCAKPVPAGATVTPMRSSARP